MVEVIEGHAFILMELAMAMPAGSRTFDPVNCLHTPADMAGYLEAALEDGDPQLLTAVLGDIARAQGMTEIARATGLGRESLYKALSPTGNPEWGTVLRVITALGLTLKVVPTPRTLRTRPAKKAVARQVKVRRKT